MTRRTGAVSVAELILTLFFFAVILAGSGEFLIRSARLASGQRDDLRMMEIVRTIRVILGGELRAVAPADIAAASPDSVRIRAFRGGGAVCGGTGAELWIDYRGNRAPDPTKDSVLLIAASGVEHVRAVEGVGAAGCGGDGLSLRLTEAPVAAAAYALLFESGAYHLSGGALRYRRGAGGRQPLTESLLLDPGLVRSSTLGFDLEIRPRPDSLRLAATRDRRIAVVGLNASRLP